MPYDANAVDAIAADLLALETAAPLDELPAGTRFGELRATGPQATGSPDAFGVFYTGGTNEPVYVPEAYAGKVGYGKLPSAGVARGGLANIPPLVWVGLAAFLLLGSK